MAIYKGFSTKDKLYPPYTLTDIELVKQDIMNTFDTRKGERVMMPEFGSRIYEYLFEQLDHRTREAILDDAKQVIATEPRVEMISIDLIESEQAITLQIELLFKPQNTAEKLYVQFQRENEGAD